MSYQVVIDDNIILSKLQANSEEGISLLYDKFHAALYTIILNIVKSESIAEEVLQDTFIKIWKNHNSYDNSKGRLFTWLLNIAKNTAIDYTRTKVFNIKNQDLDISVNYIDSKNNIKPNEDYIGLSEIVDGLSEEYRQLIQLIYFQGYTQQETADHLNIPLGTVKTRVRSAMLQLRKHFSALIFVFTKFFINL